MKAPVSRTLFELLDEQSQRHGDAIAVIASDVATSYAGLAARVRQVAVALQAQNIQRGDRVGILVSNCREWLEVCFGAGGAGGVAVPISTWSTRQELEFILADSGVVFLFALARFGERDYAADLAALAPGIVAGGLCPQFPALRQIILIQPRDNDPFTKYPDFLAAGHGHDLIPGSQARPGDDGLILYTSGSSAKPKAVRLTQSGIIENGFSIGERQGLQPGDRMLLSPPLFWSYGSANAMPATLTHGAALVLQEKFGAAESLGLIERHGCTALYTLPGMTNAILLDPGFSRERVKTLRTGLTIGSAHDVRQAAESLGAAEICNIYGATETYGNCCVTWHHWPLAQRMQCQGPPLPGNQLRFVDGETGEAVPKGAAGLTEVAGYITPGYTGASADQNALIFTPDGFYRTGDIGRLDDDGNFVFIGRNTEMIKRAGINVSPAEVEDVLLRHPKIEQAGVVGVPDAGRGELIIAFVVASCDAVVTSAELVEHCRSVASKYKIPDRIEICSELPLTPTGKLQRRNLKQVAIALVALGQGGRNG